MVHIVMCWGCLWAIVGAVGSRSGWLVCVALVVGRRLIGCWMAGGVLLVFATAFEGLLLGVVFEPLVACKVCLIGQVRPD